MACFTLHRFGFGSMVRFLPVMALVAWFAATATVEAQEVVFTSTIVVSDDGDSVSADDTPLIDYEKEHARSSAGAKVMTLNPPVGKNADEAVDSEAAKTEPAHERPSVGENKAAGDSAAEKKAADVEEQLVPLSNDLIQLRDQVRKTTASCFRYRIDTKNFTAGDVLDACLAYGCDAEVRDMSSEGGGGPASAFVCLCWNLPSAGFELLRLDNRGEIMPRIGYGYQQYPGQFLAVLAISRVSEEYPLRVGKKVGKVADLVEYEKRACRSGTDHSLRLVGLFRYVIDDRPWKNDLGETWSKERLMEEELNRAQMRLPNGGLNHLLGISYALDRRTRRDKPITGEYRRAQKYIQDYITYAVKLQEDDGSWHPGFLDYEGKGGSVESRLRSTGYILEWLVTCLSDEQLRSQPVTQAVKYVVFGLNRVHSQRGINFSSSEAVQGRMHAIRALMAYDARVFEPFDEVEEEEAAEEPAAEETAVLTAPRR